MEIVVAEPEQVDAMVAITEQARANMAAMGIDQWQCGYPDRGTWEADVAAGAAYVALDEGRVVAVFRYADEPEAAYETLEGEWLTDGPYATVHRCAVDPACRGRGIIGELFAFACEKAAADGMASVRIDTHADNEGSMRPEILLSAADVLLQGLTPGVDAPIVSTGMQDLVTICSYDVERQNQACEDDEGRLVSPLPVRTCGFAPHTR